MKDDTISRRAALDALKNSRFPGAPYVDAGISIAIGVICDLPPIDAVTVVRCKDCKHNPKLEWLGCPMASLNEKQRPETAWCWKGERKDGDEHG